jgi:putative oxidoreductase
MNTIKNLPKKSLKIVVLCFRLILAALFIIAAFGKLVDIERYSVQAVYFFVILPMFLARPFGLALPFIELLCGLGLLFGVLTRLSALGIGLLSLSFFIAKTIVFLHGRSVDCGCFGAFGQTVASITIFLDLPMIFFAMVVMWAPSDVRHWKAVGNLLPKTWRERLRFIW